MTPPKSLSKDKADETALHSPRWREDLDSQMRRSGVHVPFFYTRAGASVPLEGMYSGGHAFLLANGPSVQGLDLNPLKRRWVMTLNNGAKTFRGNANCIVDDPSRFSLSMWLDPTIMKFSPMSHFEKPLWDNRRLHARNGWAQHWKPTDLKLCDCPNVIGYRRNEKFHAPRWLTEETINWGNHKNYGGGRSVLLASIRILYILGFRHIYLVGVDFDMSPSKRYHFDEARTPGAIKCNNDTYGKLQSWFGELQPLFLKHGLQVHNCNKESRLTAFPYLPFGEALAASIAIIGDAANERTNGMYDELKNKVASAKKEERAEIAV